MQDLSFVELVALIIKKSIKKFYIIVVSTLIFLGIGIAYTSIQEPTYTVKVNLRSEHISFAESKNCISVLNHYSQKGDYKSLSEIINYDQNVLRNIINCKVKNSLSTDNYSLNPPANFEATFKVKDTSVFKHLEQIIESTFKENKSVSEQMKYSALNLELNIQDLEKSVADLDSNISALSQMKLSGSSSVMVSVDNLVNQRMTFMFSVNQTKKNIGLLKPIVVVSELRSYNPVQPGMVWILGITFLGVIVGIGIILLQEVWKFVKTI